MKIKIEIKHYITGAVLFEFEKENNTIKDTVLEAIMRFADLRSADLRFANLSSANLSSANLSFANLSSANLSSADLRSANLSFASLMGIPFENLPISYINLASRDMLFIFQSLKGELPFLRKKLIKGEIDGTAYEGDCACLVGTLANADGGLEKVCETIPYYDKGTHNPAEAWFLNIRKGSKPEDNLFAAHALKLLDSVLDKKNEK